MSNWYEAVSSDIRLTQGDIILNLPVINWKDDSDLDVSTDLSEEVLKRAFECITDDVIVMNQACDLENNKVKNVVLCPHFALDVFKKNWEDEARENSQNPTAKAWAKFCDSVKDGYQWNYCILNKGEVGSTILTHRIVDFHEIYTLPRPFVESFLKEKGKPRLRLLPPYREHLSQAFARYFMRVGLPNSVDKAW